MEEKYGVLPKGMVEDIYKRAGEKEVKRLDFVKNQSEIASQIRMFGSFYLNHYKNVLELNMPEQILIRYVYLCTYMGYDNKIYITVNKKRRLATVKDLKSIFILSDSEVRKTKKVLIENGLIIINEDKTITVNDKYAIKGKSRKRILRGSVRIMEEGIQEIYKQAKPTEHKKLALLIKILPYVNFDYNIICFNPEEKEQEEIIPMNLKELCNAVEYDETNTTRLKRDLLKIKVGGKSVIAVTELNKGHAVSINPAIYYKGKNPKAMDWLITLFKIMDKKK
jgi:Mn-dependent DtxR family transcriptional regulator